MKRFDQATLKKIYLPTKETHKGQNGKLTIVGGSHLFHGASLWSLKVASRIVDMVFYASTDENNELAMSLKKDLYDFIAVQREKVDEYIAESDAVLIGPGLPREEGRNRKEEATRDLTERLLSAHRDKKWVIDAGALQTINPEWLLWLHGRVIITPHQKEFEKLFHLKPEYDSISYMAKKYGCVILLKGEMDTVCSPSECVLIEGGNAGMTKGGTGDVLAGLVAALCCKNDLVFAAQAASFLNKQAGDALAKEVGPFYNASDLVDEIPKVMKQYLLG